MRKHFLILMLLTLLPLAGWADNLEFGTVEVGDYTYGGTAVPVPVVKDIEGSILTNNVHYTYDNVYVYKNATCLEADKVTLSNAVKAGETYYVKVTGIDAYVGKTAAPSFTVQKKKVTIEVLKTLSRNFGATTEPQIGTADSEWKVSTSTPLAWGEDKTVLLASGKTTLGYTYDGKGDPTKPGGEYTITYQDYDNTKNYDITVPTNHKFTIVGIDLSGATVTVKTGTTFADKTYKGAAFTAADLTGLVLEYTPASGPKVELTQGTDFTVSLLDVYNFTAYSAETDGDVWATGTVETLSYNSDTKVAIVKVLTNSVDGWVNKIYQATNANATTRVQLMGDGTGTNFTTASGVWVTVTPNTDAFKTVGTYNYTVNFKGNYAGKKQDFGTFKIVQAPLSVGVEDITETYKSAAYTNTFSATPTLKWYGFVGEDVANKATLIAAITNKPSVSVKQSGGATNVGDYELKISGGATPDGSNYKITNYLTNGQLHIKAAEVFLFANDAEKGPGASDPAFSLDLDPSPFKGADYIDGTTVTYTREDGNVVGESYEITPDLTNAKIYNGTGKEKKEVTSNYSLKIGTPKGKLTIKKASLTITILDQDKFYADADPATIAAPVKDKNYIVTGLVTGDQITSVTLKKSWTDASDAGNYILDADVVYTGEEHYEGLTVVPGNFEIKKAPLTVTMPIKNVASGITPAAALATLTNAGITITGFKKNEVVAETYDLSLKSGLSLSGDNLVDQSDAEGYILTLKDAYWKNYAIKNQRTIAGKLIVGAGAGATTPLDLNDEDDIADNIATLEAEVAAVDMSTLERPLNAMEWYAVVLPFATTTAELVQELGQYVVVDKIKSSTIDAAGTVTVNFEMVWDEIPAGTPFLMKPAKAANWKNTTFTGKTIVKNITAVATDKATFTGTYATDQKLLWGKDLDGTTDKEGAAYRWLAHKEYKGDNNWKNPKSTAHALAPLEAYLILDSNAVKARIFVEDIDDNGTTAIKELGVDATNKAYSVDGWYTLNGVKLQAAPTEKGVYINNGKKVVIK